MNVWSLFSGVGGFDEAFRRAGANVTLQCELDPWRRRVLAHHFPDTRQEEDVRLVRGKPGDADVLCGGFPCQDLSIAGRRAGLDGDRSGLFFEFARIAEELALVDNDGWIFLENVPGLLSSNSGRDFGVVLQTLADLGFAVGYRVLDSRYFGVPQRRRRVFIVGHPRADYARAILFEPEGSARGVEPGTAEGAEVAGTLGRSFGDRGVDVEATLAVGKKYRAQEDHDTLVAFHSTQDPISGDVSPALGKEESGAIGVSDGVTVRRLTPRECERLQGFPDDWTAIDGLPEYAQTKNGAWRAKKGTPDSRRYAAMGDAVTVNTVEWIARRIVDVA